ncbi:hypothetical protein [Dactylosporangium sp. NPDC050588]|uniref:hypothetical protein n=1 Tax=Dactylosporangium sp. NPDC050588 TaxID=3157211 RepID=UPI0033D13D7F
MQTIDDPGAALAVLHDPAFVVPPVPAATHGIAWLRSAVGRFSDGDAYTRRRALSESLLSTVDPAALRDAAASSPHLHPVQLLCTALGLPSSSRTTLATVRVVAAAYHPGTGDEPAADEAVRALVDLCGGTPDETTAARIGLLVQACDATAALIARARATSLEAALRDTPPVPATKRMATRPATLTARHPDPADSSGTRAEPGNRTAAAEPADRARPEARVEPGGRPGARVGLEGCPEGHVGLEGCPEGHVGPGSRTAVAEPADRDRPEVRVEPGGRLGARVGLEGRPEGHVGPGSRTAAAEPADRDRPEVRVEPGGRLGARVGLDGRPEGHVGLGDRFEVRVGPDGRPGVHVAPGERSGVHVAPGERSGTRDEAGRIRVEAGEVVRVSLRGIPFGAGPRRCPGRAHAIAIAEGALSAAASEHPGGGR